MLLFNYVLGFCNRFPLYVTNNMFFFLHIVGGRCLGSLEAEPIASRSTANHGEKRWRIRPAKEVYDSSKQFCL